MGQPRLKISRLGGHVPIAPGSTTPRYATVVDYAFEKNCSAFD